MSVRTTVANPASAETITEAQRAKYVQMALPGLSSAQRKTLLGSRPATRSAKARKRNAREQEKARKELGAAKRYIAKIEASSKKKPKKAKATAKKRAATQPKKEKTMARSAAQKAATKKMIAANKAARASGGGTKKKKAKTSTALATTSRKSKGPKRQTFKWPAKVTVTRRNPSTPEMVRIVGGTLVGAAVGAAGVVGVGVLMSKYPMSRNMQMAALVAGGTLVGAATSTISPLAGAAAAMPMFAAAAQLLTSTMQATPPVAGIIQPHQFGQHRPVAGVFNPANAPGIQGVFNPRTGQPATATSRAEVQGLAQRFSRAG